MTSPAGALRSPRPGVLVFAMLALVASAYATVLSGGFVWDDHELIEQQPIVQQIAAPQKYLLQKFWANPLEADNNAFYRPLTTFTYAVDHALGAGRPLMFHLTNLLLHLLACLLVFLLAMRLGAGPLPSALAGAAFGLAPRLTESVAWISGRTDVLAFVFTASALLLALRAEARGRRWWLAGAALLAGLLSKETAIVTVPVLLTWGLWERRLAPRSTGILSRAAPLGLALAVYGGLRMVASLGGVGAEAANRADLTWGEKLWTALEGLGRYLFMFLDPFQPRVRIGTPGIPNWTFVGLGVAAGCLWTGGLYVLYRRRSFDLLGLVLGALVAIGLTLHLLPIAGQVVAADRYLYFTLALMAVAAAVAVSRGPSVGRRVGLLLGLPLVLSFAAATYVRAGLWLNEKRLWEAAVAHGSPDDGLPYGELGIAYLNQYRVEEALALFRQRAQAEESRLRKRGIRFSTFALGNNAALCEQMLGHYSEAARLFEEAARLNPRKLRLKYNLAMTYARSGDFSRARELLRRQEDAGELNAFARKLESRIDKAEGALQAAARLPAGPTRSAAEAAAWDDLGALAKAREAWQGVLHSSGATPSELRAGTIFLATKGTKKQALEALAQADETIELDLTRALTARISERFE